MTCNLGWDDPLNSEGRCCCNCKFQMQLAKHHCNSDVIFQGSINEQVVDVHGNDIYVCVLDSVMGGTKAFAFDKEHGMCEMHTFKGEH